MITITSQNFSKYALRTETVLDAPVENTRRLHAILGMASEILEFQEAIMELINCTGADKDHKLHLENKAILEIGDFLWFLAIELDNLKIPFEQILSNFSNGYDTSINGDVQNLSVLSERLISLYKSDTFYKRSTVEFEVYRSLYESILLNILQIGRQYNLFEVIDECLTPVITKLDIRYPGKVFTVNKAINRNVEQEFNATLKKRSLDKDVPSCTAFAFNPKSIDE